MIFRSTLLLQVKLNDCDTNVSSNAAVAFLGTTVTSNDDTLALQSSAAGSAQNVGIQILDRTGYWNTSRSDQQISFGLNVPFGDITTSLNYSYSNNIWQNDRDHLLAFTLKIVVMSP